MPRDSKRIKPLMERLELLCSYYPDLRLGQVLENFVFPKMIVKQCAKNGDISVYTSPTRVAWIFFQEDDVTLQKINEAISNYETHHPCEVCPPCKANACSPYHKRNNECVTVPSIDIEEAIRCCTYKCKVNHANCFKCMKQKIKEGKVKNGEITRYRIL